MQEMLLKYETKGAPTRKGRCAFISCYASVTAVKCSPPEQVLARGGGEGFGRSDGEASGELMRAARLPAACREVLEARPRFDGAIEREFPAFRTREIGEVA